MLNPTFSLVVFSSFKNWMSREADKDRKKITL